MPAPVPSYPAWWLQLPVSFTVRELLGCAWGVFGWSLGRGCSPKVNAAFRGERGMEGGLVAGSLLWVSQQLWVSQNGTVKVRPEEVGCGCA